MKSRAFLADFCHALAVNPVAGGGLLRITDKREVTTLLRLADQLETRSKHYAASLELSCWAAGLLSRCTIRRKESLQKNDD